MKNKKHKFEQAVDTYIRVNGLLRQDAPVIVALSGGADSVALLAVLTSLGYRCVAAHCNFHLRGDESQRDMHHAQAVADALDVDLCIKNFDVPARMAATGESVEMACRSLRYDWFYNLLEHEHAQAIAVGHHKEDQAETFMLNALRGSGITGLAGMRPRNGHVVRPMLEVSRAEIENYLADRGLEFITDSTNDDNAFKRNHLRNVVIPALDEKFGDAAGALAKTAAHLADNLALYNLAVKKLSEEYIDRDGSSINIEAMRDTLPETQGRLLLFEILKPLGFNFTQAMNIFDATAEAAAQFGAGDTIAELSRGILELHASGNRGGALDESFRVSLNADVVTPVQISVARRHVSWFNPVRDGNRAWFDARVLDSDKAGAPVFEIRHWRRGDRMQPFGLNGTKLVSDIMTEARFTPTQKKQAWLLTRNDQILWVIGLRSSALYSVTPSTRFYIELLLR